ncbi:MAG TPA: hypothetical protein VEI96_05535 [Thermodesulfovibrionales bacterium]|nr:hypothetical protein [Thermodesulfovibrionales bacterium]
MIHLAAKYGLSDVGLRKICKKLNVPTPPAGYWAKLQHKKKEKKLPLPPLNYGELETYELKPRQECESQALKGKDADKLDPRIVESFAAVEKAAEPVIVPDRLVAPQPLVKMTLDALEKEKPDKYGVLRAWRQKYLNIRVSPSSLIRVSPSSLKRALRIMDAIIKALGKRSYKVGTGKGEGPGTHLLIHDSTLNLELTEKINSVPHVPTPAEIEKQKKYSWEKPPPYDFKPSGMLTLKIDEYNAQGYRKSWSDGKTQRLEDLLDDFIIGAIKVGIISREERLARERQRAEESRLRAEREAQRLAAEKFIKDLEENALSWSKSQQILAFIENVEKEDADRSLSPEEQKKLSDWLAKAKRYAEWLNPVKKGFPFED